MPERWLAPLRGVTTRAFREEYAPEIREAGFYGAYAPFIPANPGMRFDDRLLSELRPFPRDAADTPRLVPQVIGKHPGALREMLKALKDRGFECVDLNAGCPFPMIRKKGRGSGLLADPDALERMLEAGCDEMGPGRFSLKTRLGLERADELLAILPRIDRYPLARLVVHARTARQMYSGECDAAMAARVAAASVNRVVPNGDIPLGGEGMIGRAFVRSLGVRCDAAARLADYIARLRRGLSGDASVLGHVKELVAYWRDEAPWRRVWPVLKLTRTVDELLSSLP
jgi:tRNA-dihydrouridine synthase